MSIAPMKKNHGFTLIELIVVCVIISILAGIALPVLTSALERGRATTDKNNLSQIGKGIVQYMTDRDGSMFSASDTGTSVWPVVLQAGYVKDWRSFRSPFDKVSAARPLAPAVSTSPYPISYGINKLMLDTLEAKWVRSGSTAILAAAAVDTASAAPIPGFMSSDGTSTATSDKVVTVESGKGTSGTAYGTHQKRVKINVVFADAHVEEWDWKKYQNSVTVDPIVTQMWNPMAP